MSLSEDIRGAFRKPNNAVNQLIIINVVIWLIYLTLQMIAQSSGGDFGRWLFRSYFEVPAEPGLLVSRPWTLITYSFLHSASIFHILFNMLWFYFFGRLVNDYLGSDKVISLYVLGALAGALAYLLLFNLFPALKSPFSLLVGASASVTAIVVASATLMPNFRIHLIFLGPVKIAYIAAFMVIMSYIRTLNYQNPGGNMAHLGGALIGFLYIKSLHKGTDLGKWVTNFRMWVIGLFKPKPKVKVSYKAKQKKAQTSSSDTDVSQEEIDKILDKISQSGYESLTKEEKQKLFNASKK